MEGIAELSWRAYPSAAIMLAGAALMVLAMPVAREAWRRPATDLAKPLAMMRAFRFFVVGLAVVALGASWMWQQVWLLALALAIGGEELLESSLVIYGLRQRPKFERQAAARVAAARSSG